jgi:hypothetical protein
MLETLTAPSCPDWCRSTDHRADGSHQARIGSVHPHGTQAGRFVGVRVGQSPRSSRAAIAVYQVDTTVEHGGAPHALWLSVRDAAVFAAVVDVLGCPALADMVRRAVDMVHDPEADEEKDTLDADQPPGGAE